MIRTSNAKREKKYNRVKWPPYKGEPYFSWETTGWPSPWITAKNVAQSEHARRYPRPPHEGLIYQYTSAAALQGMIGTNSLWLTDYAYLNDVSELMHGRDKLEQVLEEFAKKSEYQHGETVFGTWLELLRNGPSPRICIASFSMDGDSLSQWRAYGGISLGFDWHQSFGYMPETILDIVTYAENEQVDRIGLFAHHHHHAYVREIEAGNGDRVNKIRTSLNELYRVIAFFKHHSFADEREVRLAYVEGPEIYEELGQNRAIKRYRASGDQMIPYVTTSDLVLESQKISQPLLPLKEVVVGPHPRAQRIRSGLQDFLAENGYPDVAVRLSDIPYQPH